MAGTIKLVRNDTRPYITVALTDQNSGLPINVSGATTRVYFRRAGETTVLSTLTCSLPNGGGDGLVRFNFPAPALDVEPGSYEGEIEIEFAPGDTQTVFKPLKFLVREEFN